jgi:hypothetical protein
VLRISGFAVIVFVLFAAGAGCITPGVPSATASEVENGIFQQVNAERVAQGKAALTRNSDLDALAREYATSKFAEATSLSTHLVYLVSNTWQLNFNGSSPRLHTDTAADQVDYCLSQPGMRDALLTEEAAETGVGVVTVGSSVYFVQVFDVIRSRGADELPIILAENPDATDPTWAELQEFLENDVTDEVEYDLEAFICGDYAEALHNNAEAAGIKAAYVPVRLNQEPGHALNAFNIDGTTVFIDVGSGDKVAYIEIGKGYGVIALDAAEGFTYTYFETYLAQFEAYFVDLDDYNSAMDTHNAEVTQYNNSGESFPQMYESKDEWYQALQDRQAELAAWLADINTEKAALGLDGTYFHPTEAIDTPDPTVVDYYIHW